MNQIVFWGRETLPKIQFEIRGEGFNKVKTFNERIRCENKGIYHGLK